MILSNITCISAEGSPPIGSILAGIPGHPIEDVKISDVMMVHSGGGTKGDAQLQVPEKEKDYPEPNMFGDDSGAWILHPACARAGDACDQD